MRITNKMMTTNCLSNINGNKMSMSKLQEQYSTGKKISKPSEDPVIAVRALKLRSNYAELTQYLEKNIPSAQSWMDTTEGALTNVATLLTTMYESFTQGTNDPLTATDRKTIVTTLQECVKQIYQEGNTQNTERYVFSGYKTNTSMSFTERTTNLSYTITENFSGADIKSETYVLNGYSAGDYTTGVTADKFTETPQTSEVYRIRLAYSDLAYDKNGTPPTIEYEVDGVKHTATVIEATDSANYYDFTKVPAPHFIPETGELIFDKGLYDTYSKADSISIDYKKESFNQYDCRPEHYFDCTVVNTNKKPGDTGYEITYTQDPKGQDIQYEINFGQKLTVNTEAKDTLNQKMAREVEELARIVEKVNKLEDDIAEVTSKLEEANIGTGDKETLTKLKAQLEVQLALESKIMSDRFGSGMTTTKEVQADINEAIADVGARYTRLQLTETRLTDQQTQLEDLISTNEDADLAEVVVKFTAQQTIYNASLSVTSKVVQNTLLDYI